MVQIPARRRGGAKGRNTIGTPNNYKTSTSVLKRLLPVPALVSELVPNISTTNNNDKYRLAADLFTGEARRRERSNIIRIMPVYYYFYFFYFHYYYDYFYYFYFYYRYYYYYYYYSQCYN